MDKPCQLKSLTLTFSWPVRDDLQATLHRAQRLIKLTLKKSLFEPWPRDRFNSAEWVVDNLKQWTEKSRQFDGLSRVMLTQYKFTDLQAGLWNGETRSSSLNEVRRIIREVFMISVRNDHSSFKIFNKNRAKPDSPDWFLFIHLPVRLSPVGSPLLSMTVIDHRLTEKKIKCGLINKGSALREFENAIPRDGRGVPNLYMYSEEESVLFRYVLKLNANKIVQKQIRKHSKSVLLDTFISPLYVDHLRMMQDVGSVNIFPSASGPSQQAAARSIASLQKLCFAETNTPDSKVDETCTRCEATGVGLKRGWLG